MMRCETVKELLEAYIEGEVSKSEQKKLEAHIAGCESCRWELTLTQSIPRLIGSLPTPPVPEDIIPSTLKQIHEAPTARWQWLRAFGAFLSRRWQFAAAASLLLVALFLGISYQRVSRQPGIAAEEVAAAAEEIKLALGIVGAATQDVQLAALTEGARALDLTKSKSKDAMRTLSKTQLEVFEKLRRDLAVLVQL